MPNPTQVERHYSYSYHLRNFISSLLIISALAAFTILSVKYLYIPTDLQREASQYVNTSIISARQVACVLPRSGHYCIFQRYIYYSLLIATIILTLVFKKDDHGLWLASGAAAAALLYSGVAAVHQMLIFGFGLRTQQYSTCEYLPVPGTSATVPICYGMDDSDRDTACMTVGAGLLAVLPMAAWSEVFKQRAATPILVLWMLLMASSHVFCAVSKTETTVHYQICRAGQVEDLPGLAYQAADFNEEWRTDFFEMASNNSSRLASGAANCLNSCFNPQGYPLRAGRNLAVMDITNIAFDQTPTLASRRLGVAFWAIYLGFSIIALLERLHESELWQPFNFILKRLYRKYSWLEWEINSWDAWQKFRKQHSRRLTCLRLLIHVIIHFPRFLSVVMFTGYVIFLEWTHWNTPESESVAAVGQFGAVVSLLLVAFAALFSEFTERPRKVEQNRGGAGNVELTTLTTGQVHVPK